MFICMLNQSVKQRFHIIIFIIHCIFCQTVLLETVHFSHLVLQKLYMLNN